MNGEVRNSNNFDKIFKTGSYLKNMRCGISESKISFKSILEMQKFFIYNFVRNPFVTIISFNQPILKIF